MTMEEYFRTICIVGTSEKATKGVIQWNEVWGNVASTKVGVNIATQRIQIDDKSVIIFLFAFEKNWMPVARTQRYALTSAVVIAFDKGDSKALDSIQNVIEEIKQSQKKRTEYVEARAFPSAFPPREHPPMALMGFRTEREEISTYKGEQLAETHGIAYYEGKLAEKEMLNTIIRDMIRESFRQ